MKQKLLILRGIQASGKTFFSKNLVNTNKDYVRISRDEFRHMLTDYQYTSKNEQLVSKLWNESFKELLKSGKSVVVDEMNLNEKYVQEKIKIAKSINPNISISEKEFPIDLKEAIERDKRRPFSVGERVIRNTWNKYIADKPEKDCYDFKYLEGVDKRDCWVFDIDGTLALKHPDRNIYDGSKVYLDMPIFPVVELVNALVYSYEIIFLSGRDSKYYDVTEKWLNYNVLSKDDFELIMRKENDNRRDSIIKKELYKEHIEPHYNVIGIVDDRKSVMRMWQNELGLFTFDVSQDCDNIGEF